MENKLCPVDERDKIIGTLLSLSWSIFCLIRNTRPNLIAVCRKKALAQSEYHCSVLKY